MAELKLQHIYKVYNKNEPIEVTELIGAETMLYSQIDNQPFITRVHSHSNVKRGQVLTLALDMNKAHFFDNKTKKPYLSKIGTNSIDNYNSL